MLINYNKNMIKKKVSDFLYEEESYKIRGACFKVYNTLGGGIREKIITRALIKELTAEGMEVESQARIDIIYNNEKIGVYIPDLVINNKILIEIKSKPYLSKEDEKQFWGYLKGSKYKLGFLVNFGPKKLFIKRFVHTQKPSA
jgi:GxxExxY protein